MFDYPDINIQHDKYMSTLHTDPELRKLFKQPFEKLQRDDASSKMSLVSCERRSHLTNKILSLLGFHLALRVLETLLPSEQRTFVGDCVIYIFIVAELAHLIKLTHEIINTIEESNHLDELVSGIHDLMYVIDSSQEIIYANQAFADIFGYPNLEHVIEKSISDLYVNPEHRKLFEQSMRSRSDRLVNYTVNVKRSSGEPFCISVDANWVN